MEQWKRMKEPYSSYMISSEGSVVSKNGTELVWNRSRGTIHPRVIVFNDEQERYASIQVRELVASNFITEYTHEMKIVMKDGSSDNPSLENLQVLTKEEFEVVTKGVPTKSQLEKYVGKNFTMKEVGDKFGLSYYRVKSLFERYGLVLEPPLSEKELEEQDLAEEEWEEYGDLYEVSNLGRVRNIKTKRVYSQPFRQVPDLAMVVAENFLANPNNFNYVGFVDGSPSNCKVSNLEWLEEPSLTDYNPVTPPSVRRFLLSVYEGNHDYYDLYELLSQLRKFGYPTTLKTLRKNLEACAAEGKLDLYLSGELNIFKVPMQEGEVRKPIEGMPGYYVTNYGRIISHKSFTKEKVLTPVTEGGTPIVYVSVSTQRLGINLRQLVAETFIPNPNNYPRVISLDRTSSNSRVDNLVWVPTAIHSKITRSNEVKDVRKYLEENGYV